MRTELDDDFDGPRRELFEGRRGDRRFNNRSDDSRFNNRFDDDYD